MASLFTQSTAAKIVDLVSRNGICRARIEDPNYRKYGRWAGWHRNAVIAPDGNAEFLADPNNPTVQCLCVGVAAAVMDVINKQGRDPAIPGVSGCNNQETRDGMHTAALILMADGNHVVMDFWQNLDVRNPIIFTTPSLFYNMAYMVTGTPFKSSTG